MKANELICRGVKLTIRTDMKNLLTAVDELEQMLMRMGIEAEFSGMMRLCGGDDRIIEEV